MMTLFAQLQVSKPSFFAGSTGLVLFECGDVPVIGESELVRQMGRQRTPRTRQKLGNGSRGIGIDDKEDKTSSGKKIKKKKKRPR